MGYDLNYKGLFQSCFEIVKNNEINRDINNMTLGLLRYVGGDDMNRINQVTWSFVINHFFSDKIKLLPVSESIITNGKFMQWYLHNTNNKIDMKQNPIEPMMFNMSCTPWDLVYDK